LHELQKCGRHLRLPNVQVADVIDTEDLLPFEAGAERDHDRAVADHVIQRAGPLSGLEDGAQGLSDRGVGQSERHGGPLADAGPPQVLPPHVNAEAAPVAEELDGVAQIDAVELGPGEALSQGGACGGAGAWVVLIQDPDDRLPGLLRLRATTGQEDDGYAEDNGGTARTYAHDRPLPLVQRPCASSAAAG